MPDQRSHRGSHPEDRRLFAQSNLPALREAVMDYSLLLTRGYAVKSALKLVGDRFSLATRQRMAVLRAACSDQSLRARRIGELSPAHCRDRPIGVDGYNLLITIESALAGGLVLIGRDGCYRDLASVHGTYRKVEETAPAIDAIFVHLNAYGASRVDWYLDRPVSNSGRLKALMTGWLASQTDATGQTSPWNVELVNSPDHILSNYVGVIATTDSAILDRNVSWVALSRDIVGTRIPDAWTVDLRTA